MKRNSRVKRNFLVATVVPAALVVVLALALAACGSGGVLGETGSPATSSPATSPTSVPEVSASASPSATPSTGASPTLGESRTIPFEPDGAPELAGTLTLTEMGTGTQVTVEFESFSLPEVGGAARLLVGACGGANQAVADLDITNGRIEGLVPIEMESLLQLPHAVAIYRSEDAAEPLACVDLPMADIAASPSPSAS